MSYWVAVGLAASPLALLEREGARRARPALASTAALGILLGWHVLAWAASHWTLFVVMGRGLPSTAWNTMGAVEVLSWAPAETLLLFAPSIASLEVLIVGRSLAWSMPRHLVAIALVSIAGCVVHRSVGPQVLWTQNHFPVNELASISLPFLAALTDRFVGQPAGHAEDGVS